MVLTPDPGEVLTAGWYTELLEGATFVHRNHAILWRTAKELMKTRRVAYQDMRRLVDTVHQGLACPYLLRGWRDEAEQMDLQDRNKAIRFTSCWGPDVGYRWVDRIWDDDHVPTRLGDGVDIVLVRDAGSIGILPYRPIGRNWLSGLLRLRPSQVAGLTPTPIGGLPPDARDILSGKVVLVLEKRPPMDWGRLRLGPGPGFGDFQLTLNKFSGKAARSARQGLAFRLLAQGFDLIREEGHVQDAIHPVGYRGVVVPTVENDPLVGGPTQQIGQLFLGNVRGERLRRRGARLRIRVEILLPIVVGLPLGQAAGSALIDVVPIGAELVEHGSGERDAITAADVARCLDTR